MEHFDIAIIASYHQEILAAEWFFTIKELGKKCLIITPNPNEFNTLKKQNINVVYLNDYFPDSVPSQAEIKRYFSEHKVADLEAYVATEKSYYEQSNSHIFHYAYKYASAFDKLYDTISITTVLHGAQGGEVVRRVASLMADKHSINVIYLGEMFIPNTINLYSDEFRTVLKPVVKRELPAEEAQKIIDDKISRKPVIHYGTEKRKYVGTPLIEKFYNLIKDGNWNIIRAYFIRKKIISLDYLKREIYTRLFGVFKDFKPDEKYFYMPYNVVAESEIYIRNAAFSDPVSVTEKLAKNLPAGFKLYVKIHPGIEGHLSIEAYRRLVKIENVVPLKGSVNSFDVVKHSQGVILVSSTVGLESYIMGKPTCIIGHWPYTPYGNFIVAPDLNEVFDKIMASPKPNDPVRFIQNVYKESIDGSLYGNAEQFKLMVKNIFDMTYLRDVKNER